MYPLLVYDIEQFIRAKKMNRIFLILLLLYSNAAYSNQEDGILEIQKISGNVFIHTSYVKLPKIGNYPSNGLIVLDKKDAYIVDTPWPEKDTQELLKWIKASGFTLKGSISTHFHEDRTSGIGYLNDHSIDTYASALTNQFLEGKNRDKATVEIQSKEFSLLEDKIEVYYPGAGHSRDNIVVWLPQSKILFGGCLIRSLSTKVLGNTEDASVKDWASSVKNIKIKFPDIDKVIPGHGKFGSTELLNHTIQLVKNNRAKTK